MGNNKHLPMMGVGPIYGVAVVVLTVAAMVLNFNGLFDFCYVAVLHIPFIVIGILLAAFGLSLWIRALFVSKIDDGILNNRLVTTGVYANVRNPIYSAFLLMCTGALMMCGNLIVLILPFVYWWLMTVLMKCTEEKWLKNLYGKQYEEYCKRVNRCIPWFKK